MNKKMAEYHETVIPYLNTNPELDDAVFGLWKHWNENGIDMNSAMRDFFKACSIAPNIGRFEHYVPHCLQVARRCEESGKKIAENYPFLSSELEPNQMAFKGLIEDSFYLVGGNGKNNPRGVDSNPYHEILTDIQLRHMGLDRLADGMAMHGVASEILASEDGQEKFPEISAPKRNISLEVLTGIDFLCTRDWLPETYGSYEDCLRYRVDDLRERRKDPTHPLIVGLDNGGEERLLEILNKIKRMENGEMSLKEVESFYIR